MDNFEEIKQRSLGGIGSLIKRQALTKLIYLAANIVLARLLVPQLFGIYAIVSFIVQFISIFGELGLGAALIQKRDDLDQCELSSIFWFQQAIAWVIVIVLILAAPLLVTLFPSLPHDSVWLIRVMAISMIVSSFKSVPVLILERKLDFRRIAYIDIAESVSFHTVVVGLAFAGCGVWSFVIASICRSAATVAIVFSCTHWRPRFEFNFTSVQRLLRLGLSYQSSNVLSFVKDAVTPLFVGSLIGTAAVGYVSWARDFAFAPMMLADSFGRVAFPAFSRIQDNKDLLGRTIELSIRMMTVVMFPITALMVALAPELTNLIYTDKWQPGMNAFYFYCTSPAVVGVFLPLYCGVLSLGNARIILLLTIGLVIIEWGIGVPCVLSFGFIGVAVSQPITVPFYTYLYKIILSKNSVHIKLFKNIIPQLIAALLTGIVIKSLAKVLVVDFLILGALLFIGLAAYVLLLLIINRETLKEVLSYSKSIVGNGFKI